MLTSPIAAAAVLSTAKSNRRGSGSDGFARAMQARGPAPALPALLKNAGLATINISPGKKLETAMIAFQREATMTPLERARRDVLKEKLLTEEQIHRMSPDDREKTETMIAEEVMKRLRLPEPIRTDTQVTVAAFLLDHPVAA